MRSDWNQFVFLLLMLVELISTSLVQDLSSDRFTCSGKVIGGYYADVQEKCQMFHVCTIGEKGEIRDIVFRCLNGTVFDQETRVCEREAEVDCSETLSFYHLNNELYGPGIIPATLGGRIIDGPTTVTHKDIQTSDSCEGLEHHALVSVPESDCKDFHMCIRTEDKKMLMRSFRCVQNGFAFNQFTGKCSQTTFKCEKSRIYLKEAQIIDPLHVCSLLPRGALIMDQLSTCDQYFQCPDSFQSPIGVHICPKGFLFSQREGSCVRSRKLNCRESKNELLRHLSLLEYIGSRNPTKGLDNLEHIEMFSRKSNTFTRTKRAFSFELRNHHREASPGNLANAAGIVSDHASVIEAQGPGNMNEGNFPVHDFPVNFHAKGRDSDKKHSLSPVFNHGAIKVEKSPLAKTETIAIKNCGKREKVEISASDQSGKVTITSIVPKFVTQNGNGNCNNETMDEVPTEAETADQLLGMDENATINDTVSNITSNLEVTEKPLEIQETTLQPEEETTVVEDTTIEVTTASTTTTSATTTMTSTTTLLSSSTGSTKSASETVSDTTDTVTFTCKDKELEQFYPDYEQNCTIFHYCSPGFMDTEVLDLTFVCSGNTRFDIVSKKCEDLNTVICRKPETTTPTPPVTQTPSTVTVPVTVTTPSTTTIQSTTVIPSTTTFISTTTSVTEIDVTTVAPMKPALASQLATEEAFIMEDIDSTASSMSHSLVTDITNDASTDFIDDNEITSESLLPTDFSSDFPDIQVSQGPPIDNEEVGSLSTLNTEDLSLSLNTVNGGHTVSEVTVSSIGPTLSLEITAATSQAPISRQPLLSSDEPVPLVDDVSLLSSPTETFSIKDTSSNLSLNIDHTPP